MSELKFPLCLASLMKDPPTHEGNPPTVNKGFAIAKTSFERIRRTLMSDPDKGACLYDLPMDLLRIWVEGAEEHIRAMDPIPDEWQVTTAARHEGVLWGFVFQWKDGVIWLWEPENMTYRGP